MAELGRAWLSQWRLDPSSIYLNHGTVGVTPRRVLATQQRWRDRMEEHPSRFLLREAVPMLGERAHQPGLLREAAGEVAAFVNARPHDLGFVTNVTAAINAVLRAVPFDAGDEIVLFDHAYGAIVNAATAIGGARGARVVLARLPARVHEPRQVMDALDAALTPRTRLAILDHVTSSSALVLPIEELVRLCHARGAPVLVDGAHAPGAIPVDVTAIGAEWYAANLHKWAWAPRSCGFLHAREDVQRGLHAPVISWGLDQGLAAELDWQGTFDPTPMLSAPDAIAMLRELGVAHVQGYNRGLALKAIEVLRARVGAEPLAGDALIGTMATLALPPSFGTTRADADTLRDRLLLEHRVEVHAYAHEGEVCVRVGAQLYNDVDDLHALADALAAIQG